jgi:hypothetical protein
LENCKTVIEHSLTYLISSDHLNNENLFSIDDLVFQRNESDVFVHFSDDITQQKIVIFNSQLSKRNEIVRFRVNRPNINVVSNDDGKMVLKNVQISIAWPNTDGVKLENLRNKPNRFRHNRFVNKPFNSRLVNLENFNHSVDNLNNSEKSTATFITNGDDFIKLADSTQTNFHTDFATQFDENSFELLFEVSLDQLSSKSYTIKLEPDLKPKSSEISFYHPNMTPKMREELKFNLENKCVYNFF